MTGPGPGRRPDLYYVELDRRLRALKPLAETVLAVEPCRWFLEYLDAGEYGLAVEVASEAIPSEDALPGTSELRAGLLAEAELMGLPDAVIGRLRL